MGQRVPRDGEPERARALRPCRRDGRCYGGHLGADTLVFNLEILMTTMTGPSVLRKMDPQTGLAIWQ